MFVKLSQLIKFRDDDKFGNDDKLLLWQYSFSSEFGNFGNSFNDNELQSKIIRESGRFGNEFKSFTPQKSVSREFGNSGNVINLLSSQ